MKHLGPPPHVCLITEGKAQSGNYEAQKTIIVNLARQAAEDGVGLVQIREKALPARLVFDLAAALVEQLRSFDTLVLVNDRPDIAVAARADGVHLPATSMSPAVVRRTFGRELTIGVSTHTVEHAAVSAKEGADFVFFGPVFHSPGKGEALGIDALREVCLRLEGFPVIALGGIDPMNLHDAIASGASGVAAIRSLNEANARIAICRAIGAEYDHSPLE